LSNAIATLSSHVAMLRNIPATLSNIIMMCRIINIL
jgi:hypothetical protein